MSVQRLRQRHNEAKAEYYKVYRQRIDSYNTALESAKAKIQLFIDSVYLTKLNELEAKTNQAQNELETELEQIALTGEGAPYPLETKLQREVQKKRWDPISTIYGVVEVITRTSVHPKHQHYVPQVGQFVVRHVDAKGKPVIKYDTSFHGWKPVDPSVQRNEKFFTLREIKV